MSITSNNLQNLQTYNFKASHEKTPLCMLLSGYEDIVGDTIEQQVESDCDHYLSSSYEAHNELNELFNEDEIIEMINNQEYDLNSIYSELGEIGISTMIDKVNEDQGLNMTAQVDKKIYFPKEYNFQTCSISFDIICQPNQDGVLSTPLSIVLNEYKADFIQYLLNTYQSRSGFISFVKSDLNEFLENENPEFQQKVALDFLCNESYKGLSYCDLYNTMLDGDKPTNEILSEHTRFSEDFLNAISQAENLLETKTNQKKFLELHEMVI